MYARKTSTESSGQMYAGVAIPGYSETGKKTWLSGDRSGRQQLVYKWGRLNDRGGGCV